MAETHVILRVMENEIMNNVARKSLVLLSVGRNGERFTKAMDS